MKMLVSSDCCLITASARCPASVSRGRVAPGRRMGAEQGGSEGGHRLSCFGKRTSGPQTSESPM